VTNKVRLPLFAMTLCSFGLSVAGPNAFSGVSASACDQCQTNGPGFGQCVQSCSGWAYCTGVGNSACIVQNLC
jgi:hypothetical protein